MSFRDRLLGLLDEHEQLEKQHAAVLANLKSISMADGMRNSTADAMRASQASVCECRSQKLLDRNDAQSAPDDHERPVLGERYAADLQQDNLSLGMPKDTPAALNSSDVSDCGDNRCEAALSESHLNPFISEEIGELQRNSSNVVRSDLLGIQRRKKRLKKALQVSEACDQKDEMFHKERQEFSDLGRVARLKRVTKHDVEVFFDSWIGLVIIINSVFIGLQMDFDVDKGFGMWALFDIIFFCIFTSEICLKCCIHGARRHFCGPGRAPNLFDVFLIIADALQLVMSFLDLKKSAVKAGLPSQSFLRVIRLIRVIRLVRLLNTDQLKDFLAMIQGMLHGFKTLIWAVVVFSLMTYTVALLCRASLGDYEIDNVQPYFSSVPRSMYTVFRCCFGDCTTEYGSPIPVHIGAEFGFLYALTYCGFVFVITIGLFNVISAIFVEATTTSAANVAMKTANCRLDDDELWSRNVTKIIKVLLRADEKNVHMPWDELSTMVDDLALEEFERELMDELVVKNSEVRESLDALDINRLDFKRLSDILDPDHNGTINMLDLINGLQRLRGHPRRSDVVTVDLMVRKLQETVDEMHESLFEVHSQTSNIHRFHRFHSQSEPRNCDLNFESL